MTEVDISEIESFMAQPGPICTTCAVRDLLSPEDQAKMDAALAAPNITDTAVIRWLKSKGHKLSDKQLGRHRRGECRGDGNAES